MNYGENMESRGVRPYFRMGIHNGQGLGIFGWWVASGCPVFPFLLQTVTIKNGKNVVRCAKKPYIIV